MTAGMFSILITLLGLLTTILVISSAHAQVDECKFINVTDQSVVHERLFCSVSENTEIGEVVLCADDVIVEEGVDVTVESHPVFDSRIELGTNHLQIVVSNNISKFLQQDNVTITRPMEHFPISCQPGGDKLLAVVTILPENNHDPEFAKKDYLFAFKETEGVNYVINKEEPIIVVDRDYRNNPVSDVTVYIESGNEDGWIELNQIRPSTSAAIFEVRLNLLKSVPYKKGGYSLVLKAEDKGEIPRSSRINVSITVDDVDNQDPVFDYSVYTTTLYITEKENGNLFVSDKDNDIGTEFSENVNTVEFVGNIPLNLSPENLFTYDQDIGIDAKILYEVVSDNVPFAGHFSINRDNGQLSFRKISKLFLAENSVSILIKAFQEDNEKRHAFAMVTVNLVTNLIGQQPIVFQHTTDILRTHSTDTPFYIIKSFGTNLKYEISGKDSNKVKLSNGNQLFFNDVIEDDVKILEIDVTATSTKSILENRHEMRLLFNVVDRKNSDSLFNKDIFVASVFSDSEVGSVLFEIGTYANVAISISSVEPPEDRSMFDLQNNNIVLKENFSQSLTKIYKIGVRGFLQSDNREDFATVILHIVEVYHPTEPLFTRVLYSVDLLSDAKEGSKVIQIETTSPDVQVAIEGVQPIEAENIFRLEKNEILLAKKFDGLTEKFTISLSGNVGHKNDSAKVTVYVRKRLDSDSRVFEKCVYSVTVAKAAPDKHLLVDFSEKSHDNDVKYYVVSGDVENEFTMQPVGKLLLNTDAHYLKEDVYYLVVSASDHTVKMEDQGFPEVRGDQALVVLVIERDPQFLHPRPLVKVFAPDALLSDYAFKIEVKPSRRTAVFSIKDSNNFAINRETGLVYFLKDVTKIQGFTDELQVTASYNDGLESDIKIYIFRLEWSQTLKLTMNSQAYVDMDKIQRKLSRITDCDIFALNYEIIESENKERLLKRNADMRVSITLGALDKNRTILSLENFESLNFSKDELQNEIGDYKVESASSKEEEKEREVIVVNDSNTGGLIAGNVTLGVLLFLLLLVGILLIISQKYRINVPLISKIPDLFTKKTEKMHATDTNEDSVVKSVRDWRPPTPPLRRITEDNKSTYETLGHENHSFYADTGETDSDKLKLENIYLNIVDDEETEKAKDANTNNSIGHHSKDNVEIVQLRSDQPPSHVMSSEGRKSLVTFSEETEIIP